MNFHWFLACIYHLPLQWAKGLGHVFEFAVVEFGGKRYIQLQGLAEGVFSPVVSSPHFSPVTNSHLITGLMQRRVTPWKIVLSQNDRALHLWMNAWSRDPWWPHLIVTWASNRLLMYLSTEIWGLLQHLVLPNTTPEDDLFTNMSGDLNFSTSYFLWASTWRLVQLCVPTSGIQNCRGTFA